MLKQWTRYYRGPLAVAYACRLCAYVDQRARAASRTGDPAFAFRASATQRARVVKHFKTHHPDIAASLR